MSQGLPSRFTAWTQDVHATVPEPHEYLSLWTPTLCVAPQDVFHDYEVVMARLNEDSESEGEDDLCNSQEAGSPSQKSVVAESPTVVASEDDADTLLGEDDDYGSDYCETPSGRRAMNMPITHSGKPLPRGSRTAIHRKERKQNPYDPKHRPTKYQSTPSEDDAPEDAPSRRCTYVDPQDGTKCKKINKSAQEAGRHWRSCHLYKEAKAMLTGNMTVGKGTIITSKEQLEEVKPNIQCPSCFSFITRSDAMRRHKKTNCKSG